MKRKITMAICLLAFFIFPFQSVDSVVNVRGYYRSDGTYVRSHVRSNPNGLKYDNYSFRPSQGLYNKTYGTRDAYWDTPTYITDSDYYTGKSLYESNQSYYSYKTPVITTPSCPSNSYYNYNSESCKCSSGYVADGGKCVSGGTYCKNQYGFASRYSSLTNTCSCQSGYEFVNQRCQSKVQRSYFTDNDTLLKNNKKEYVTARHAWTIYDSPRGGSPLYTMQDGGKYYLLQEKGGWLKIGGDDWSGWVPRSYVEISDSQSTLNGYYDENKTTQKNKRERVKARYSWTIYDAPGGGSPMSHLKKDGIYYLIEKDDKWLKIGGEDWSGWVPEYYVEQAI